MEKNIRKTIRFSENEFAKIENKLSEHKLTFSEFARNAILNKRIKTKLTSEMIYQVAKIGTNINQIAKSLNSRKDDIPNSKILKVLIEIQKQIEVIKSDT